MLLTNIVLEDILDAFEKVNIRYQWAGGFSSEWDSLVLPRGMVVVLEDRQQIAICDGVRRVEECPYIPYGNVIYYQDDSPIVIASKMWQELQANARLCELIEYPYIPEITLEFIGQQPANFTFFLGEPMTQDSPIYQFRQVCPNFAGQFARNFDHGKGVDPDGNRDAWTKQNHALQEHEHDTVTGQASASGFFFSLQYGGGEGGRGVVGQPTEAVQGTPVYIADETRPMNNTALFLMRIAT